MSLRGRDLRYGTFDRSDLQRADFIAADLSGASFRGADLRNVTFDCANRGTTQDCTKLTKSILTGAKLTGVTINHAEISGIVLRQTDLRGFDFASVNLSNADLSETKLRGTNFSFANLIGANLSSTDAEGARFYHTLMLASDLSGAKLDGANLNGADLSGALMGGVSLFATNLMDARLFGAFLREAHVWQTFPAAAKAYALADLTKIQIQRPSEEDIPRLQEAAEFLKALPDDPYSWGPKRPSLADMTAWEGWAASDEKAVWQSLVNGNRQPGADSVGRYLGDLACLSDGVFLGILATRSEIYGTYFDLGGSYPDPIGVLPPGVSDSDVRQSGDLGFISTSSRVVPPRFPEQPELATAFYQRIKEPNCMATKRLSSETLENLRREIDAAKRRASSRASPANIQIPTIAR